MNHCTLHPYLGIAFAQYTVSIKQNGHACPMCALANGVLEHTIDNDNLT